MPIRGRVGRHANTGGRNCQNWTDDQNVVIALLNRIPIDKGGAGGSLTGRLVAGIVSNTLYQAILRFQKLHFPEDQTGFVEVGGRMLAQMETLAAARPPASAPSKKSTQELRKTFEAERESARQVAAGRKAFEAHRETARKDAAGRVAALKKDLDQNIQIFLNEWQSETKLAVGAVALPGDSKSHRNWFFALAGNLLWAATVFIPVGGTAVTAVKAIVAVMSVGGAVIGSGTLTEFEGQPGGAPADPKVWITDAIHRARNDLDGYFTGMSETWAKELDSWAVATHNTVSSEVQLIHVWSKIFPSIPYQTRAGVIYNETKENVEAMLADYFRQWQDYQNRYVPPHQRIQRSIYDSAYRPNFVPIYGSFEPDLRRHWEKFKNGRLPLPKATRAG